MPRERILLQRPDARHMTGRLEAIWIKRAHRGRMEPVSAAGVRAGFGLIGNADESSTRQVSILDQDGWEAAVRETGAAVDPIRRRANLLVRGVALAEARGRTLRIGACLFRIRGELRPCERMDEAQPGLRDALKKHWRGGVFAQALSDGEIAVGDEVAWGDDPVDA
ncbi:MAG: MOSC domain-containing protein [Planctomycetes bacterium]|nr:MOSC domain-containing protein [Planctomycetota bacterium]